MFRATSPPRKMVEDDPKWHFEEESEASMLGSHFAYAIAAIATGNKEQLSIATTHPSISSSSSKFHNNNHNFPPFRKIFYEEPQNNPGLNTPTVSAGFDAHITEERSHWSQKGTVFPHEKRKFGIPPDRGPTRPVEFPFVFEKPIKAYDRKGDIRPFSRVKKISSQARLHYNPPAKIEERPISPDRYRFPDPWVEASKSTLGVAPVSSAFKSRTERFSSPVPSMPSRPHSSYEFKQTPSIHSASRTSAQVAAVPTITVNGIQGSESLQLSIERPQSSSRPYTADPLTTTVSVSSSMEEITNQLSFKRARSADNIKRNKTPGHTFAKFPRNTSPKTKETITKIITDSAIKRSSSSAYDQNLDHHISLQLEAEIRPLSRGIQQFVSSSPPATPSHAAIQLPPPFFDDENDDDDDWTPRPSLPTLSKSRSNGKILKKSFSMKDGIANTSKAQSLSKSISQDSPHFVPSLHEPAIHPIRASRPMCYSTKSFKDLFIVNDTMNAKQTTSSTNTTTNTSSNNGVPKSPNASKLLDANYPMEPHLRKSHDEYFPQSENNKQRFRDILSHSAIKSPKQYYFQPLQQNLMINLSNANIIDK